LGTGLRKVQAESEERGSLSEGQSEAPKEKILKYLTCSLSFHSLRVNCETSRGPDLPAVSQGKRGILRRSTETESHKEISTQRKGMRYQLPLEINDEKEQKRAKGGSKFILYKIMKKRGKEYYI